jgi:hypothetical protein
VNVVPRIIHSTEATTAILNHIFRVGILFFIVGKATDNEVSPQRPLMSARFPRADQQFPTSYRRSMAGAMIAAPETCRVGCGGESRRSAMVRAGCHHHGGTAIAGGKEAGSYRMWHVRTTHLDVSASSFSCHAMRSARGSALKRMSSFSSYGVAGLDDQ